MRSKAQGPVSSAPQRAPSALPARLLCAPVLTPQAARQPQNAPGAPHPRLGAQVVARGPASAGVGSGVQSAGVKGAQDLCLTDF